MEVQTDLKVGDVASESGPVPWRRGSSGGVHDAVTWWKRRCRAPCRRGGHNWTVPRSGDGDWRRRRACAKVCESFDLVKKKEKEKKKKTYVAAMACGTVNAVVFETSSS